MRVTPKFFQFSCFEACRRPEPFQSDLNATLAPAFQFLPLPAAKFITLPLRPTAVTPYAVSFLPLRRSFRFRRALGLSLRYFV